MNTDQLIEMLAREATPVSRRLSPAQRAALWSAVALLCVAIGLGHFGGRRDIADAWRSTDMMLRVFLLASIAWLAVMTASPLLVDANARIRLLLTGYHFVRFCIKRIFVKSRHAKNSAR